MQQCPGCGRHILLSKHPFIHGAGVALLQSDSHDPCEQCGSHGGQLWCRIVSSRSIHVGVPPLVDMVMAHLIRQHAHGHVGPSNELPDVFLNEWFQKAIEVRGCDPRQLQWTMGELDHSDTDEDDCMRSMSIYVTEEDAYASIDQLPTTLESLEIQFMGKSPLKCHVPTHLENLSSIALVVPNLTTRLHEKLANDTLSLPTTLTSLSWKMPAIEKRVLWSAMSCCKMLRRIEFVGCSVLDDWMLNTIAHEVDGLRELVISSCPNCTEFGLICVGTVFGSRFENLSLLDISRNRQFTDKIASSLAVHTSLISLSCSRCSFTSTGIRILSARMCHLEALDLRYCGLDTSTLSDIVSRNTLLADIALGGHILVPQRGYSVARPVLDYSTLQALCPLPHLSRLKVAAMTGRPKALLKALASMHSLVEVTLGADIEIEEADLRVLMMSLPRLLHVRR